MMQMTVRGIGVTIAIPFLLAIINFVMVLHAAQLVPKTKPGKIQ